MPMMSSPSEAEPSSLTLVKRALARVVGRPPAPQHVLGVEDQQVLATDPEEAWRGDGPALVLGPLLDDERGFLRLEADPVDGLGRLVDDVRVAIGPADHLAQVERVGAFGRREGVEIGRGDRDHAVQAVQAGVDLLPQRREDGRADVRRGGDVELLVRIGEQVEGLVGFVGHEVDARLR